MSDDTLLVLSGIGIPDYSARGLTQTLQPIGCNQLTPNDQRRPQGLVVRAIPHIQVEHLLP